jgi:hypothetical protein
MVNKIPHDQILKGKRLFNVIGTVHKGIDSEVERVKELKIKYEYEKQKNE